MFKRFLPKEEKFFHLFDEISTLIVQSADELLESLKNPTLVQTKAQQIKEIESKADGITHTTLEKLHNTFITPFDRNDIYSLIQSLDDVVDLVHATAQRLVMYPLATIPDITIQLAEKSRDVMIQVQKAVSGLHHLNKPEGLRNTCLEIHRLENESDVLFREAIARLFREENDMKILISLKDVNEILETIADRCENIASLIESIILEYA